MIARNSQMCMSSNCHFGESSKLESRVIFKTHPPEEPLKITPQLRVPNGSVPSCLRHGRGGAGPSGITCDCKLLRVGSTCRRVMRQVCKSPPNSHILALACDCACESCILWTDAPQCLAAGLTSTTGMSASSQLEDGDGGTS